MVDINFSDAYQIRTKNKNKNKNMNCSDLKLEIKTRINPSLLNMTGFKKNTRIRILF